MEPLTLAMYVITIALFIARTRIKNKSLDLVCVVQCICAVCIMLRDTTVPVDNLLMFAMPLIAILMLSLVHVIFGEDSAKDRW